MGQKVKRSDYLNFDLKIRANGNSLYTVEVINSPAGEASATMSFAPEDLAMRNQLQEVQNALLRYGTRVKLTREEKIVRDFGATLFKMLMAGDVCNRYDVSRRRADEEKKGLRLKLRVEAPELAAIPWEFIYDERSPQEYVCLSKGTPFVRYLEMPQPTPSLKVLKRLRVLGIIASPNNQPPLDVAKEKRHVERALRELRQAKKVDLVWAPGPTWRHLQQAMREGPWHILHFIGHSGFDTQNDEGFITLADESNNSYPLSATELARLLDDPELRLVLLNSCESARSGELDIYSSTASILLKRGIPAVLAMQFPITDKAAIEFSRSFYEAVANELPVDAAVAEGRISVSMGRSLEWGTPVLHMRSSDGVLFRMPKRLPSSIRVEEKPAPFVESRQPLPVPSASTVTVLAVMGAKGGVGKSTFVSCTAQFFAEAGSEVAVIDYDLDSCGTTKDAVRRRKAELKAEFPPVRKVFDHVAPHSTSFANHDGPENEDLWDITPQYLKERKLGRIWLLPAAESSYYSKWDVVADIPRPREERLLKLTQEMIDRVRRERPGVRWILIDCGAGSNPIFSAAFTAAQVGYIIINPDESFFEDVEHIKEQHRHYFPRESRHHIFTVVNRVTSEADIDRTRNCFPAAYIPRNPLLEEHQFSAPVDYDIGYSDVFNAIYDCIRKTVPPEDREDVRDEVDVRIRPWWNRFVEQGLAQKILGSPSFRRKTILSWALAALSAAAFVALLFLAIRQRFFLTDEQRQETFVIVGMVPLVALLIFVLSLYWLRRQLARRRLLRRVMSLSRERGDDKELLSDMLAQTDRSPLRWLNQMLQQAQDEEKKRRLQSSKQSVP